MFWALASAARSGRLDLGSVVVYAQAAVGASMIAFGGLTWALDGAAAPVAAVLRLEAAMARAGRSPSGAPRPAAGLPAREIRFRDVTFAYPGSARPVLDGLRPHDSGRLVARDRRPERRRQDDARQAAVPALRPAGGRHRRDGVDLRELDVDAWRSRLTAVFQDFVRFELPLRDNVAPGGAPDDVIRAALAEAGAAGLAELDTLLARGYDGGTDLSGGQWQRVALARALCAVRHGAGLVLLDEPTAQLDVRGEAEIFDRILAATRHATTILISHRFSTVRHADRICVLEHGRVVELGTHDELMALGGRYRTMFELQASASRPTRTRTEAVDVPRLSRSPPALCRRCGGCCKLGYRHEPRLMLVAFALSLLAALPDALLALWLKLLGDGVLRGRPSACCSLRPSGSACRRPRPGSCARSARACSGASATR